MKKENIKVGAKFMYSGDPSWNRDQGKIFTITFIKNTRFWVYPILTNSPTAFSHSELVCYATEVI